MKEEQNRRVWAYARDPDVHSSVVIGQMSRLLGEAEQRSIPIVGMSQDRSDGRTLDRQGLKDALRAIRI